MAIEWRRVTWYSQIVAILLALAIFGVGFWLGGKTEDAKMDREMQGMGLPGMDDMNPGGTMQGVQNGTPVINDVTYACDAKKTVRAIFKQGSVQLLLSDGRNLTVPQAISADGGRYANDDESFVFWSKGQSAFITEGAGAKATTTFANCTVAPQPE